MKRHQFGQSPRKIIWFQIAGLEEEHLAMLRFSQSNAEIKTSFEDMICMGKFWTFNLYKLRPTVEQSFWSQISGKKDIQGKCSDYNYKPAWDYLLAAGYRSGLLEIESQISNSITQRHLCLIQTQPDIKEKIPYWLMSSQGRTTQDRVVSFSDRLPLDEGTYFDKSCTQGKCTSDVPRVVLGAYDLLKSRSERIFLMVRDFSYSEALAKNDFTRAQLILEQFNKILQALNKDNQDTHDALILITSSYVKSTQFPIQGKMWEEFEQSGKNAQVKEPRLMGTVWAGGARAENFCGMFEEAEILDRILSGPKQQGLELKIINPFAN